MSINFEHVFYNYDGNSLLSSNALNDISFSLDGHFFTAIVGETGSGKSTLIQHINALLKPTKGKINVDGFEIDAEKKKIKNVKDLRKHAGVVFQFAEYQLFEETILKDVCFGPINFKDDEETALKKAKNALKEVGINESYYEKSPFEISGGEKRRVAIAGIIAIEPKILILDEPTAGLDPKHAKEVMNLFYSLYLKGTSIIIVTHDMDVVLKYCDNVLCLKEGKLLGKYDKFNFFYNDELMKTCLIEEPKIVSFTKKLINNGVKLNVNNIVDIDSLVNELKRREK